MSDPDLPNLVRKLASAARAASAALGRADTAVKNAVLRRVARALEGPSRAVVLEANERDLAVAQDLNLSAAMADRLRLDPERLAALVHDLVSLVALPDPVGQIEAHKVHEGGVRSGRMTVPLGVVALIHEGHPQLTAEAAAIAIKSGNACVLRGGKEATHSSEALARIFADALAAEGLPAAAVTLLPSGPREATAALLAHDDLVDLAIVRGGASLVRYVHQHARMPVLAAGPGVRHVYVDARADLPTAERVLRDAKSAAGTVLVARDVATLQVPRLCAVLASEGVGVRGCEAVRALHPAARMAPPPSYDAASSDHAVNVRVVDGYEAALAHIAQHGSRHTEVIVTDSWLTAQRFLRDVDASAVLVNASPRFNDAGRLGLGKELGVSTSKLHAYGPIGPAELCTKKWIVYAEGQVRA